MDLAKQVQQLRLVHRLEKEAERNLLDTEIMQGRRWELLRRVAGYAGDSYTAMRIDVVDERLRDQGAPIWLGAMLTVGMTLIPVTALTGALLAGLTTHTQKLLTRSDRALMQKAERFLETRGSFDSPNWAATARDWKLAQDAIKKNEERLAYYKDEWLEPELTNKLQEDASVLAQHLGKPPFGRDGAPQPIQKDVPGVQIKKSLDGWIETQILAEDIASKKIRQQIRNLADIATSLNPRKEAMEKEAWEAIEADRKRFPPQRMSRRAPEASRRSPEGPLPTKNETALDQLQILRMQLAQTSVESRITPSSEARWDLQLAIELMIWASTYSFKTTRVFIGKDWEKRPRTLPGDLWKRLIERYPDQAKEGPTPHITRGIQSLLTEEDVINMQAQLRLSNFFNKQYLDIDAENMAMVNRFRAPGLRQQ